MATRGSLSQRKYAASAAAATDAAIDAGDPDEGIFWASGDRLFPPKGIHVYLSKQVSGERCLCVLVCVLCFVRVCVCVFIELHITAQSSPVILLVIFRSH